MEFEARCERFWTELGYRVCTAKDTACMAVIGPGRPNRTVLHRDFFGLFDGMATHFLDGLVFYQCKKDFRKWHLQNKGRVLKRDIRMFPLPKNVRKYVMFENPDGSLGRLLLQGGGRK